MIVIIGAILSYLPAIASCALFWSKNNKCQGIGSQDYYKFRMYSISIRVDRTLETEKEWGSYPPKIIYKLKRKLLIGAFTGGCVCIDACLYATLVCVNL